MAGILTQLAAKLTLDTKGYRKGLQDAEKKTSTFAKGLKGLGALTAGAFGVSAIIKYSSQLANLNKDIENSTRAFQRFGDAAMLEDLRRATGYMINDLKLMQQAIQAVNLNLNEADLATFFKFATIRAAETGMEVDHLVESIVTGIGRESRLVLDNLGISLLALNKEIAKGGTFAEAATRLIKKVAEESNTSVVQATKGTKELQAAWENLTIAVATSGIGEEFDTIFLGLSKVVNLITNNIDRILLFERVMIALSTFGASESTFAGWGQLAEYIERIDYSLSNLPKWLEEFNKQQPDQEFKLEGSFLTTIGAMENRIKDLKQLQKETWDATLVQKFGDEIDILKEKIAKMYGKGGTIGGPTIGTLGAKGIGYDADIFETEILVKATDLLIDHIAATKDLSDAQYTLAGSNDLYNGSLITTGEILPNVSEEFMNLALSIGLMSLNVAESMEAMGRAFSSGDNILKAFGDFMMDLGFMMLEFGALMVSYGIAEEVFQKGGPYAKIAAGIALIGIAASMAGSIANMNSHVGGGSAGGGSYSSGGGSDWSSNYDYNREIVMVARGDDLVAVLGSTNEKQGYNYGI